MNLASPGSIRRDVISAYVAAGAKVFSWAVVSALVYRQSRTDFAMLALVRGTIGLLNYTSLGLAPAMVRVIAMARKSRAAPPAAFPVAPGGVLPYATPPQEEQDPVVVSYSNGLIVALLAGAVGLTLTCLYAAFAGQLHVLPTGWNAAGLGWLIGAIGLGTVLRLVSDSAGAVLQTQGQIARDNACLAGCELVWLVGSIWFYVNNGTAMQGAAASYVLAGIFLVGSRFSAAHEMTSLYLPGPRSLNGQIIGQLLSTGILIAVAQLADFLYAPTDYILINRLISPAAVAIYAPAVQIDAALLLLVGGIASVLLPRSAIAHAAEDLTTVRRYYIRGTLAGTAVLALAAIAIWLISPVLLRLWLGESPTTGQTLAILPLVLIHTVVGGSSGVGRSILLGIGKVKPFTISVLVAGAVNVLLSTCFVTIFNLGLRGIIYGTITAVTARCVLWMPWYVLSNLQPTRRADATAANGAQ